MLLFNCYNLCFIQIFKLKKEEKKFIKFLAMFPLVVVTL